MPQDFDFNVLTEMQHVLIISPDEFKAARESKHLGRIIALHYLFRKNLREIHKKSSKKRHVFIKIFHTHIQKPEGRKKVLGIIGGINFLRDQEISEERHLLKAVQHYIPGTRAIQHSFFANKKGAEMISTFYLEIDKSSSEAFTKEEINLLRRELSGDLKNRVEQKLHPVFMPRNEEEIMRNILSLSNQLKYLRDIPQVFITFDEQSHTHLFFTVIVVRILKPDSLSIQEMFKLSNTFLIYLHDQTKMVGYIRKKYAKEATVFHIKLSKELFLRLDHSIDLYKARQTVAAELTRILGEIRDYNGGMISKQHELLTRVRNLLMDIGDFQELLLENFFYSLSPVVMRTLLEPSVFKKLFLMLLKAFSESADCQDDPCLNIYGEPQYVFAMISSEDPSVKEKIHKAINKLHPASTELAHAYVKIHDRCYLGFIYCSSEIGQRDLFCKTLQAVCQPIVCLEPVQNLSVRF